MKTIRWRASAGSPQTLSTSSSRRASDGRRMSVRLTASGRALAAELEADVQTLLAPLIDAMSGAEQSAFVALVAARTPTPD